MFAYLYHVEDFDRMIMLTLLIVSVPVARDILMMTVHSRGRPSTKT